MPQMTSARTPSPPPELATDLWWTWNPQAREVFRRLDYTLWRQTAHNPVLMLRSVSPELLDAGGQRRPVPRASTTRRSTRSTRARSAQDTWWQHRFAHATPARSPTSPPSSRCTSRCRSTPAASACSPAITARKRATSACRSSASASCIRRATSTRACRPKAGSRNRTSGSTGTTRRSSRRVTADGKPCIVPVPLGNRSVLVQVWRVRLGRVKLYLLDTDLEENAPWDRELSARLYGGDRETRIQQEIILGIGGVRALKALGSAPAVWHLNEGHAAFVVLQRIRDYIESGLSFDDGARGSAADDGLHDAHAGARRARRVSVQPGRDASRRLLGHARRVPRSLHGARRATTTAAGPQFNMTALALRAAGGVNAVSQLHGVVTREMWGPIWPGVAEDDAAGPRHHQRRPRADLAVERDGAPVRRLPAGRLARPPRRARAVGDASSRSRTRSCGRRGRRCGNYLFAFIRERARAALAGRAGQRGARRRGRHAARSERAHDRLRAAVHRLQAAGADLPRPRAAAGAS